MAKTEKDISDKGSFCTMPEQARAAAHAGSHKPLADALVVTLCETASLAVWQDCGILEREWSLYQALAPLYGMIVLVSDGDRAEHELAASLNAACPVRVVANEDQLDRAGFAAQVPGQIAQILSKTARVLIKTDQFWGGSLGVEIASHLRREGITAGLIARGGYLWSRFCAWEAGTDSLWAIEAAAAERELCSASDVVVGTTERMLDDLAWRYTLNRSKMRCVPNFVPDSASPDAAIRPRPGTVLFAGRLEKQKRIDMLIEACAQAASSVSMPIELTIVGSGSEQKYLEKCAHTWMRQGRLVVSFVPRVHQAELLEMMKRTAVYAQASAYEGHPKVVLEALACSTPVAVVDAPGLADVVVAGQTGLVTAPSAQALGRGLVDLLTNSTRAQALGDAAGRAADAWRFGRVLEEEIAVHREAMARAGAGATAPPGAVRWGPELLTVDADQAASAWARSMHGYARRLSPEKRARFCATVETPLYDVIDRAAIETAGGVHPKHHLMRYHEFFVERIKPGEGVLDLGCGYGAVARSIVLGADAHVTGMDFSESNLAQARAMIEREGLENRLTLLKGDITRQRAGSEDARFDVVVLSNVLEHLADRARLLGQYVTWYQPRVILIRVPAFDRNWQTAWKDELGVDSRCDPTHETEYTQASLRAELTEAGLHICETISRWGEYWVCAEPAPVTGAAGKEPGGSQMIELGLSGAGHPVKVSSPA